MNLRLICSFSCIMLLWHLFGIEGANSRISDRPNRDLIGLERFTTEFVLNPQDSVPIIQTDLKITNNDSISCLIMFEQDTCLTDSTAIYNRFIHRKGDMSLIQWILDGNVVWDSWKDILYETFFKILAPNHSFEVIFITQPNGKPFMISEKHLRIIPLSTIERWKIMRLISPDMKPAFQPDVLVIPNFR